MKSRKLFAAPLVAGLMLTSLAACGGDNGTSGGATGGNGSTGSGGSGNSNALAKSAINPQERDAISDGGNVTLPVNSLADNWNPSHAAGNEVDFSSVRSPMSARFITTDEEGKVEIDKTWLQDMTAEEKDGKTVVTIKMNPKAAWNDGTDYTLADWTNTIKALSGTDKAFEIVSSEGWEQIEKAEQGGDEDTFLITFKKTYPDWQGLLGGGPARAESVADAKVFNTGWTDLKKAVDAGWFSGPYTLDKIDKSAGNVVLKKNPNWWGEAPKLDTVTFVVKDPNSTASAYLNGEIDAFDIGVNADSYAKASGYGEGEIRRANSLAWRHFTFNSQAASLKDPAIRKAIVQYLDRGQIAKSDLAGMSLPEIPTLNNHVFMQDQAQYKDVSEETGIKFDQAAAEKTMTDAGYAKGSDGIWAKDGKPVDIKFTTLSGVKVSENEGKQFQDQMTKFGFKVTMAPVPSDKMSDTLTKKAFEIIAFTWVGTPFPYGAPNQFFSVKSSSNYSGFKGDITKELETISTNMDQAKRDEAVLAVEKKVWEDPQILPLYQRPAQVAVKKKLANYGAYGLITPTMWENVGWTK